MTFKYFSGFSLENEKDIFKEYIIENDFTVSGFSYGAIKAFEYVLDTQKRVDLLQLFSPAFFELTNEKFKRSQLLYFKKDKEKYCKNFIQNIAFPSKINMDKYFKEGNSKELEELLYYKWDKDFLQKIVDRNIKIEVYLGEKDKIIDANAAKDFFKNFARVYYIKEKGHILK